MSGVLGRFTSADAPFADQHPDDPQGWNLYGYVRNNPLKFVDVDGRETRISLIARPLQRSAAGYGHAYIRYSNPVTDDARIARAAPSAEYPGGATEATFNRSYPNITLQAEDTTLNETNEILGGAQAKVLAELVISPDLEDVSSFIGIINEKINESGILYAPQDTNSNSYAGTAFRLLTGVNPENKSGIKLPGLEKDLSLPPISVLRKPKKKHSEQNSVTSESANQR